MIIIKFLGSVFAGFCFGLVVYELVDRMKGDKDG